MKAIGKIWNGTSLIVKILIGLVLTPPAMCCLPQPRSSGSGSSRAESFPCKDPLLNSTGK